MLVRHVYPHTPLNITCEFFKVAQIVYSPIGLRQMKKPRLHLQNHLFRKSRWAIAKKRRRLAARAKFRERIREQNRLLPTKERLNWLVPYYEVHLSGALDMLGSPQTTFAQLLELDSIVPQWWRRQVRVRIRMDNLDSIDAPSLLFLCSRMAWISEFGFVTGVWPRKTSVLKTLIDAGFPSFLRDEPPKQPASGPPRLVLHMGTTGPIKTDTAADVQNFIVRVNPGLSMIEQDSIYTAAGECLENVHIHAYKRLDREVDADRKSPAYKADGTPEKEQKRRLKRSHFEKWYVVGLHDYASATSTVAILDMGIGITASAYRQDSWIRRFIDMHFRSTSAIIKEVTLGERTESGLPGRGKGLRSLKDFAIQTANRRLHVLSEDGMVTWDQEHGCVEHEIPYTHGTIVCLQIQSPLEPENPDAN